MWKDRVRSVLDTTPFVTRRRQRRGEQACREWRTVRHESPIPPHAVKSARIREVARRYGCTTLIETGTCLGEMVQATLDVFDRVHTIELSPVFAARCRDRFANRPQVQIHHGNSADLLPTILSRVSARALIWLDAHYSGGHTARGPEDSPIVPELEAIAVHPRHCVLIDDAHMFVGTGGYPTLEATEALTHRLFPQRRFVVADNIVELLPHSGILGG